MMLTILQLFWSFCKIGFTSFGGLSMIPLINSEMVSHSWMTITEVSDIVAIAEMTPGPLGLNCATFSGMRVAGLVGSLAANLGMLMPTFTLCGVAAVYFERFKESTLLKRMMIGVRPVCIGLIAAVLLNLAVTNYLIDWTVQLAPLLIGCGGFFALIKLKWSVPQVILVSAVLGLLFC